MQQVIQEEIVKVQPKGLITLPKRLRQGILEENSLARVRKEKGRLIIEPVRTLPYPVRGYTDQEVQEFVALDAKESKELKKKGLV